MNPRRLLMFACLGPLVWGCDDGEQTVVDAAADALVNDAGEGDAGGLADSGAMSDAGDLSDAGTAMDTLFTRLPGLWSGPAGETPLGAFAVMNMDVRAADTRQLFSRFDLDAENNLRFAFAQEDVDGVPTLVYRNGGFFLGLERDTRTVLVEQTGDLWRFCHGPRGCEYLEASFAFTGADQLLLTVSVRGMAHLRWPARRVEPRAVPDEFEPRVGPHDAPFPPMPSLAVRATWREPLPEATKAWLLLSDTPCGFTGSCKPARVLSAEAPAGATEVTLTLDQVHAGDYSLNVILDRNGNFERRLFPDRGDGIAGLDHPLTIAPDGETQVNRTISLTVP